MPETLNYRFAQSEEVAEAAALVVHSFPGPTRTPEWWQEQLADPSYGGGHTTLFVGRTEDRIVAALQLHPLRQWIAGAELPVAGVATVAISPTHRKRRLGGDLMAAALRAAHDRGDVASSLYPFRMTFYQKFGYGQAGEALQYQVSPSCLPDSEERSRVELMASDAQRAEVLAFYNQWARTQTGQLERSLRTWLGSVAVQDHGLVAYRADTGELQGYALVIYRTDIPRRDRYLEVEELVWTSTAARRGLYGWLSSLGDQWDQVMMRGLPSHKIGDWIREPRLPHGAAPMWGQWRPGATLMMGPMFRLLDTAKAWNGRRVATQTRGAVELEVADAQIEENRGTWRLAFDGGTASIERARVSTVSAPSATIRLDISTLSRLFIGALSSSAAESAGLLTCDRPDALPALDAALALPEPWTFDRF